MPRNAVVVAPHPDDETIGAYGLIRLLRSRGCRVRILIVSDGAGSHRSSAKWPAAKLVAERRRESLRAMRALGVIATDMIFMGLPDGHLGEQPAHDTAIRRALGRMPCIDLIVAPIIEDTHPDHSFVAKVVARANLFGARRLGYCVWTDGTSRAGPRRGHPLGAVRSAKRAAIGRYRTQTGSIQDDPTGFAISANELSAFSRPTELFKEERRCGRLR